MTIINIKINLPLSLCEFAIRNDFFSPLRLYIYLKTISAGQIRLDTTIKKNISKTLGIGVKTVSSQLQKLQDRNWVGYNKASGYYFVRGFDKIRELEYLRGRRGVWVDVSKDIQDKKRFCAFVKGAVIGQLTNVSKYKAKKEQEGREPEHTKGSSNHRLRPSLPSFYPVSCHALSRILGITISTASEYKAQAQEYGYIQVEKKMVRLPLTGNAKDHDANLAPIYKASHPDVAHKVRIVKGKVYLQEADHAMACMNYTKKWRPRPK